MEIDALVQSKIDLDTEFQAPLETLSQEEADQAIAEKKSELIKAEFTSLSEKTSKADELAKNYKIRAEKAEAAAKQPKGEPETPKTSAMDLKDIRALQDVHDDDVDEVVEYAKFKGVSVAEVKKSPVIQAHLRTREEERKTAVATNTGPSGKGSSKVSGDSWLDVAATENALPDSDEEMTKLSRAFVEKRSKNLK